MKNSSRPRITDVSNNKINVTGRVSLSTEVEGLRATILYWVVSNLVVDGILGTLFIDTCVRSIIPPTRRLTLKGVSEVALVRQETVIKQTEKIGKAVEQRRQLPGRHSSQELLK